MRSRGRTPAAGGGPIGLWALVCAALLLGAARAQPPLVVNGVAVPGNTTALVSGTSYAPAASLAQALGAQYFTDAQRTVATLKLGGRLLQADVVAISDATAAGGLRLDGAPVAGSSAVLDGSEVFLPVKPVVEAFGGTVAYLQEQGSVVAVLPRARLSGLAVESGGGGESVVLRLSSPVRYSVYYNEPVNVLELHVERTDLPRAVTPVSGDRVVSAAASAAAGSVDVRVQLQPDVTYRVYDVPAGRGFQVVVGLTRGGAATATAPSARVVLDPGHGGEDAGLSFAGFGSEAALTLAFVERLRGALTSRGLDVSLTRDSDRDVPLETRSQDGVGADLFVSVHAAALPAGQFHAYFLADADSVASLDMAIRQNAESAAQRAETDSLRRRILLDLVPDLEAGRGFADAISAELFQAGGYRSSDTAGAPLYVLGGAAGRGVMLEFSPQDLASSALPDAVAAALVRALAGRAQ